MGSHGSLISEKSFLIPLVHDEVAWPACVTVIKCSATLIKVLGNPTDHWPATFCRKIFQGYNQCITCLLF